MKFLDKPAQTLNNKMHVRVEVLRDFDSCYPRKLENLGQSKIRSCSSGVMWELSRLRRTKSSIRSRIMFHNLTCGIRVWIYKSETLSPSTQMGKSLVSLRWDAPSRSQKHWWPPSSSTQSRWPKDLTIYFWFSKVIFIESLNGQWTSISNSELYDMFGNETRAVGASAKKQDFSIFWRGIRLGSDFVKDLDWGRGSWGPVWNQSVNKPHVQLFFCN